MRNLILSILMLVCGFSYAQTFDFSCAPEVAPDPADTAALGPWSLSGEEIEQEGSRTTTIVLSGTDVVQESTAPYDQEFLNYIQTQTEVTRAVFAIYETRSCIVTINGLEDAVAPDCGDAELRRVARYEEKTIDALTRILEDVVTGVSDTPNPNYQPDTEWAPAYDNTVAGTTTQTKWEAGVERTRVITVEVTSAGADLSVTEADEQRDINGDGDMLDVFSRSRTSITVFWAQDGLSGTLEPSRIVHGDYVIFQNNDPVVVPEDTATQILEDAILGDGDLSFTVSGTTYTFNRRSIAGGSAFDFTYGPDEIGIMTISVVHTNNTVVRIDVTHYDENELVVVSDVGTFDYANVSAGDTTYLDGFISHMEGVLTRYQQ